MNNNFTLDFVGIGAERSATTWLSDCLREHPEIFLPKQKELYFFNEYDPHFLKVKNLKYNRGLSWYKGFFKDAPEKAVKGEFSPTYLYSKLTSERIKKQFPNVKIIVSIRNPTERAFSQYLHDKHIGVIPENKTFEEVIKTHRNYIEKGLYAKYLMYFFPLFPRKNIHLILYDDIEKNPETVIRNLYKFLGVAGDFIPSVVNKKIYTAVAAKFQLLNYILLHMEYLLRHKNLQFILRLLEITGIRKLAFTVNNYVNVKPLNSYPKIKIDTRKYLINTFLPDILKLEKLTKLDLSEWKK